MNSVTASDGLDKRCTPRDIFNSFAGIGVSQQMVDAFFTDKGLDISEDPDYNDVEVYDITYTFWDNNKIHTMVSTMPTGAKNEYSYTYFDK